MDDVVSDTGERGAAGRIVESFISARNAHDAERAARLLASDIEWSMPRSAGAPLHGREALDALVGGLERELFRPGTVARTIKRCLVDGGIVVVEYTVTGTTLAGTDYANDYCWVYEVDGEVITRITSYSDTLGSTQAFGADRLAAGLARTRQK